MKHIVTSFAAALVVALAAVGASAQEDGKYKDLLPTQEQKDSASYMLGVNFGVMIKNYGFGSLNYDEIMTGLKTAAESKLGVDDEGFEEQFRIAPSEMGRILDGYLDMMNAYRLQKNKDAGEAYAANYLRENKKARVTEDGLVYRIIKRGNKKRVTSDSDVVTCTYTLYNIDGKVIDSGEGVDFTLTRVIKGFAQGMYLIGKGGKIELVIPYDLAYGERGTTTIEPGETLRFVVKIEDIAKGEAE